MNQSLKTKLKSSKDTFQFLNFDNYPFPHKILLFSSPNTDLAEKTTKSFGVFWVSHKVLCGV